MSATVCITPLTLGYPEGAGHFWAYLNWALSLRALGCRVIWLEDIGEVAATRSPAQLEREITRFEERLQAHGLGSALALTGFDRYRLDPSLFADRLDLEAAAEASDLVLDFAYDTPAAALSLFARSALVDLDPGLLQLWMSEGDLQVAEHGTYFTIGETVGTSDAVFPDGGVGWVHTPPPVFLPAWPTARGQPDGRYTTVTNWWGEWLWLDGRSVNNEKRTAFLHYAELPARVAPEFELALTLDDYTAATDKQLLERNGWSVCDAWQVCSTPQQYRDYIVASRGEFSCAKPSCRLLSNAWVSDRTLCYLASGRPAVVEHTGKSSYLPDAEGLWRFRDIDEAVRAIESVESDYERQSELARALAEEHFDGERIVRRVLERAL